MVERERFHYRGGMDDNMKPCGSGTATRDEDGWTYRLSGTWKNGKLHGVCK